jgi:hypothetical protein
MFLWPLIFYTIVALAWGIFFTLNFIFVVIAPLLAATQSLPHLQHSSAAVWWLAMLNDLYQSSFGRIGFGIFEFIVTFVLWFSVSGWIYWHVIEKAKIHGLGHQEIMASGDQDRMA